MKLYIRVFGLMLVLALALAGCKVSTGKDQNGQTLDTVQGLFVRDIPNDGGDGLVIGWKPLPREKRIQEYRIYRGLTPDSLFYLASVAVNVKTGVASDSMYYYDSGYNDFVDINSPGKLKHEKQKKGSILYRSIPRDMELVARLSEGYNLYSIMESTDYYRRTKKAFSADSEDKTVYSGVKINQQSISASLKTYNPDSEEDKILYYYTVVPVNERNQYLGIAEPKCGFPVDDAPEASPNLYCTALQDSMTLRFEWEYPVNKSDLAFYQIMAVPEMPDSQWCKIKGTPQAMANALPVAQGQINGGAFKNYAAVKHDELPAGLSWERASTSRYAIQFYDYRNNPSPLSRQACVVLSDSSKLPQAAQFVVEDKPNDKGDRLTVVWNEPIVFISKTSIIKRENGNKGLFAKLGLAGKGGTRLKINYQLNKTDVQKVNNIYFELLVPGSDKPFARVNEFYQDNIIKVTLPKGYDLNKGLKVRIKMNTSPYEINPKNGRITYQKGRLVPNYVLEQNLVWDNQMMSLMPSAELFRNGVDVSSVHNTVFRKTFSGSQFTLVKKNTSYDNSLDVTIPYVANVGKPVLGFNFVKGGTLYTYMGGERYTRKLKAGEKIQNLTLVESQIDLKYVKQDDPKDSRTIRTSVFKDEAAKELDKMRQDIKDNKAEIATKQAEMKAIPGGAANPQAQALQQQIEALTAKNESLAKTIKIYENDPDYKKSLTFRGNRGRMNFVASIREPLSRLQSYMIVKTNGRGLFTESYPEKDAQGDYIYNLAVSNWFDWNKLVTLVACIIFGVGVVVFVRLAKQGKDLYIRPIAGLQEIDNAIGRATEMGRPMLYCMGNGGLSDVATLASLGILGLVARKAAEYDTKLIVPCYDYIVMPIAQEIVREAHYAVGRPDSYDKNNIFYLTSVQFAYVAGVNGIMIRERMATNFFLGYFAAEALLMTETGNTVGAVQIAGSDAITQIPFFITTCDYTLIGEELYAASAYLNREPMLLGTLKAQDYFKFLILIFVILGGILASFQVTGLMQLFPIK